MSITEHGKHVTCTLGPCHEWLLQLLVYNILPLFLCKYRVCTVDTFNDYCLWTVKCPEDQLRQSRVLLPWSALSLKP